MRNPTVSEWRVTAAGAQVSQVASAEEWPQVYPPAPPRPNGEGDGPFDRLVLEGGMLIDGTYAPRGPVTIIIERNRIVSIQGSGPRLEIGSNDRRIDASGSYLLPGFVNTHTRIQHSEGAVTPTEYALKLLLAHGITTTTSMQRENHLDWAFELQKQSAANEITSPRIQVWTDLSVRTPEEAREKVRAYAQRGVSGLGEGAISGAPEVKRAGLAEAKKVGLLSMWHMDMERVPRFNVLDAARAGLGGVAHFYGLPEAMFEDRTLQHFPTDFNHSDSRTRFQQSGRLWAQAAKPYSERWNKVLDELLELGLTLEPTFSVYEVHRDEMGVSRGEWHDEYLHPNLARYFEPKRDGQNFHYDWTSTNEVEWKNNFRLWMTFVNEYKNRGGRVIAGDDGAFDFVNYGFGFVRNLELLHEAGFSPLEVISSATIQSAEFLRMDKEIGSVEVGKLADLVIVDQNPLENLKVLYGTGVISLDERGAVTRVGGVKYTIKDGIAFDAKKLLADVRRMVAQAKSSSKQTRS